MLFYQCQKAHFVKNICISFIKIYGDADDADDADNDDDDHHHHNDDNDDACYTMVEDPSWWETGIEGQLPLSW